MCASKNSQAIKNGEALLNLWQKNDKIKSGSQEMATNISRFALKSINLKNICGHFLADTFDFTTFFHSSISGPHHFLQFIVSHFFFYGIKGPNAGL